MAYKRFIILLLLVIAPLSMAEDKLKVTADKENVVSSRLEGTWEIEPAITRRLMERVDQKELKLTIKSDGSVLKQIPQKYHESLSKKTIYFAGKASGFGKEEQIVLLIENRGNPHLLIFRDKNGEKLGDTESVNVVLTPAKDASKDLLFVGGDFNTEPFIALQRVKKP